MNAFQKKVTLKVLGIHVAIIFLVGVIPLMQSCFRPKPREIITFIEFGDAPPKVSVQRVDRLEHPTPPERAEVPDVEKPPPKIQTPIKEPTPIPKEEVKPPPKKPTYTRPKDIKIGERVNETPPKPTLSNTDINNVLNNIQEPTKTTGSVGNPDEHAAYDALIQRTFYGAWTRPASSALRPAEVTISLNSSGRVVSSRLKQSSGDANFDATVMSAVRSVKIMSRKPPKGYQLNNNTVRFRIED